MDEPVCSLKSPVSSEMEKFDGMSDRRIREGLMRFNGLKRFGRHEDMFYSKNGKYIVLGPTTIVIRRNLKTGKKPRVDINWKLFFSSNLKNAVALRKKIFLMVSYEILLEDGSEDQHIAILFVDPAEQVARYIDSWTSSFDEINANAIQQEVPWEYLYGEKQVNLYVYKYNNGIPNSCALDCLYSIDRIMYLNSFQKAATETLFLRRVRHLKNNKINIKSPYDFTGHVWYYNGMRYCYDVLVQQRVIREKRVRI